MNGTYLEGDCNQNVFVSIWITIMASAQEGNLNVHKRAQTLGSCCFRCLPLPRSFLISRAGSTQRKERRGMRAFGSPLCHHGPTYRMCHLQGMSFCPPPSSPSPSYWWRWDATPPTEDGVNVLKRRHGCLFIFHSVHSVSVIYGKYCIIHFYCCFLGIYYQNWFLFTFQTLFFQIKLPAISFLVNDCPQLTLVECKNIQSSKY